MLVEHVVTAVDLLLALSVVCLTIGSEPVPALVVTWIVVVVSVAA